MKTLNTITYKISTDHLLLAKEQHITPQVSEILEDIYNDVLKGKKKMINKLIKLSLKYPKVPQFKNNLAAVYQAQGNIKKAYETNKWIIAEHPNYLFGKLNLANEYNYKKEFEKVTGVLGEAMEISELYPERDEFHVDEVMSFNVTAISYFLGIKDEEQAEIRLEIMKEIDEDHPKTEHAISLMMRYNLLKMPDFFKKQQEKVIQVTVSDRKAENQTTENPRFHFPKQMDYLYNNDTTISEELLTEILALNSKELTEDLITIIKDSIIRFDFYNVQVDENGWDEKKYSFLTHALFLLSEIKNPNALDDVLNIARQNDDYIDFWFGDIMIDIYGCTIYELAKINLSDILKFLKEPNIYCFNKSVIIEAIIFIANSNSEKYDEIINFCDQLLTFHIENKDNRDIVDTEFLGLFISELIDLKAKKLLPEIEQLFQLDIVGYWICGHFEDVKKEMLSSKDYSHDKLSFNLNLKEKYERINTYTFNNNFEEDSEIEEDNYPITPINSTKKIGRNEPCFCGSGKKYKKCCLH